jgi:hypothetical protein
MAGKSATPWGPAHTYSHLWDRVRTDEAVRLAMTI